MKFGGAHLHLAPNKFLIDIRLEKKTENQRTKLTISVFQTGNSPYSNNMQLLLAQNNRNPLLMTHYEKFDSERNRQ